MKMTRRESIVTRTMGTLGLLGLKVQPGSLLASDKEPNLGKTAKITLLQINDCHGYVDHHLE